MNLKIGFTILPSPYIAVYAFENLYIIFIIVITINIGVEQNATNDNGKAYWILMTSECG